MSIAMAEALCGMLAAPAHEYLAAGALSLERCVIVCSYRCMYAFIGALIFYRMKAVAAS